MKIVNSRWLVTHKKEGVKKSVIKFNIAGILTNYTDDLEEKSFAYGWDYDSKEIVPGKKINFRIPNEELKLLGTFSSETTIRGTAVSKKLKTAWIFEAKLLIDTDKSSDSIFESKDLCGTTWNIQNVANGQTFEREFEFLPTKKLLRKKENKVDIEKNHFWRIHDDSLTINIDSGNVQYFGKKKGDKIEGRAKNNKGNWWSFTASKNAPNKITSFSYELIVNSKWLWKPREQKNNPEVKLKNKYFTFSIDGSLIRESIRGNVSEDDDNWRIEKDMLIIELSDKYSCYVCRIYYSHLLNTYSIYGKGFNKVGNSWMFEADLISKSTKIYSKEEFNDSSNVSFYKNYHKYWLVYKDVRNPDFDDYSSKLLNLKKNETDFALNYFYKEIESFLLDIDFVICYVPSSNKDKLTTGVRRLAELLTKDKNRVNGTSCIIRHKTIPKAAHGGERSIDIHLSSLKIVNTSLIKDKTVLLLDDVTTTGSSLLACKQLLTEAGAKEVYCFALGKTY